MRKKIILVFFVIIALFVRINSLDAMTTSSNFPKCYAGQSDSDTGALAGAGKYDGWWNYTYNGESNKNCKLTDTDGKQYFCLEMGVSIGQSKTYTYVKTIESKGQACGVLRAYLDGYISAPTSAGTKYYDTDANLKNGNYGALNNYYRIQELIWDREGTSLTCEPSENEVNKYKVTQTYARNLSATDNINMTKEGNYYVAEINVTKTNLYDKYSLTHSLPSGSVVSTSKNGSSVSSANSNKLYVRIPVSAVSTSQSYTIKLSGNFYKYKVSQLIPFIEIYASGNYQKLGRAGMRREDAYIYEKLEFTIDLNVKVEDYPTFKIQKTDSSGTKINGAKFAIYYDKDCGTADYKLYDTKTVNGEYTIANSFYTGLAEYWNGYWSNEVYFSIKETSAPSGYTKDDTCYNFSYNLSTKKVKSETGSYTNSYTLTVKNQKGCEGEFQDLINSNSVTKQSRINLYKKYPTATNLLNFSSYSNDAVNACKQATCNKTLSKGCLNASNNNLVFNSENLSCYDFVLGDNSNPIYCATKFDLINNLSTSWTNSSRVIYSGQPILKFTDSGVIATLNLTIECYGYGTNAAINSTYDKYISSISFGGNTIEPVGGSRDLITLQNQSGNSDYKKYVATLTKNYSFKAQYVHILNGMLSDEAGNSKSLLTYGPVSKLNDKDGTYNLNFSLTFGSELSKYSNIKNLTDDTCKYTIVNQIIEEDTGELNLEFRVIDATVGIDTYDYEKILFPGKLGDGRKVGSNWCKENITSCASDNKLEDVNMEPIINDLNSYGRNPSTGASGSAKYVIELNSSDIQAIRAYNDEVNYDTYDLDCDLTKDSCTSNFLEMLKMQRIETPSGKVYTLNNKLAGTSVG